MSDLTRRTFLEQVGKAGGGTAVYSAMSALGLLAMPDKAAFALSGHGKANGKRVVILGAGMAGMCAAYELGKLGYDCRVLEARTRPGGRCHTVKRGQVETDTDGHTQTCDFDDGLYMNPGPARIPQHHVTLDYCRELNVPVEMFNNDNQNAYLYHEDRGEEKVGPLGGKRVRMREAKSDLYGYTAELLAKAVSQSELDARLTSDDKEKLVEFLRVDGGLSEDLFYRNGKDAPKPKPAPVSPGRQAKRSRISEIADRRGYKTLPGAGLSPGEKADPFDLSAIIQSGFGLHFQFSYELDQQLTMFQIVGGTHNLAKAFARVLGHKISYQAVVQEIRQSASGVRVVYKDSEGKTQEATGDYCICAIPLAVLKKIPADFAPVMKKAIGTVSYDPVGKIALQFKRRFWEEDDRIFGGMSWTNLPITQIWYPATGFLSKKGIVIGYYNYGLDAIAMSALPHKGRLEQAMAQGRKIHPQYDAEYETSFSHAWHKDPYSLGAWASYRGGLRETVYPTLNEPDGRIWLAGEHLSYMTGWMAGALESARKVCKEIHSRAAQEKSAEHSHAKGGKVAA